MTPFQNALSLVNHGLVLLPVDAHKKPMTKWQEYQTERPTVNTYRRWEERFRNANPAVITGKISNVVVLDIDDPSFAADMFKGDWPETPISKTPRGFHIWFRHPGYHIPNSANRSLGVDFRGDGGYVVVPPAISLDGYYQWVQSIEDYDFDPLPEWVIDLFPTMKAKLAMPTMRGERF
jgi:Bifunctional DNA primase/polymerase, N-terminal